MAAAVRQLLMPKLGLTMTEGIVAQWPLVEGARFSQGDIYLVVETDKVTTDVEAPESGRLVRICVPQGETVPVGTVLAEWEADTSTTEEPSEEAAAPPTAAPERQWRKADLLELTTARRRGRIDGVRGLAFLNDVRGTLQSPQALFT